VAVARGGPRGFRSLLAWLRAHPIVCLLLLTPGIPEYLSGSTSLEPLLLNPVVFFLFLPLNLALYGPGVLLVREAMIRWHKGWATVVALGAAYAIAEEGLAVDTFFYPRAGPVGALGFYGHWLGVNWVWLTGIIMVHVVYSIGLPILLHGLALPETRGRSLLTNRGIVTALAVLGADVVVLQLFVIREYLFWFGAPILAASVLVILLLVGTGRLLPARALAPSAQFAPRSRWALFLVGLVLLPGTFVLESIHGTAAYFPAVTMLVLVGFYSGLLWTARRALGPPSNVRGLVAFATGALVPIMAFGLVANAAVPVVLIGDAAALSFLWMLWRRHPDAPTPAAPAAGPTLPATG
jgi:hypothetical protein